jgi:putative endonuclease
MTTQYQEHVFVHDVTPVAARRRRGKRAFLSGSAAEEGVARVYERRGLILAERRWRGGGAEIDLIFRDGAAVVFVEVKSSATFERAAESLGAAQMRRIWSAAEVFLGAEPAGQLTDARIDVALVNGRGEVRIVADAIAHF